MCKALEDWYAEAIEKGLEQGIEQAKRESVLKQIVQIQKKVRKGKTLALIADELEEEPEAIAPFYEMILAHPEETQEAICQLLM